MPQYCDSKKLERTWYQWILASSVPELEEYRKFGLLWTKAIGYVQTKDGTDLLCRGKLLRDPSSPIRAHCIALANPIFLNSYDGTVPSRGTIFVDGQPRSFDLPLNGELSLLSDSWLHNLYEDRFAQVVRVVPELRQEEYMQERPTDESWHGLLGDIDKICQGIAQRFKPRTEEEHHELSNDALLQVTKKLVDRKLVYTPGRAPVFNLLTTTIYRIMYSIMNRRKTQRDGLNRLIADAKAGILPDHRSLRVQTQPRIKPQ